jgi:hypothetical protein
VEVDEKETKEKTQEKKEPKKRKKKEQEEEEKEDNVNRPSETIRENIEISTKESLGYYV